MRLLWFKCDLWWWIKGRMYRRVSNCNWVFNIIVCPACPAPTRFISIVHAKWLTARTAPCTNESHKHTIQIYLIWFFLKAQVAYAKCHWHAYLPHGAWNFTKCTVRTMYKHTVHWIRVESQVNRIVCNLIFQMKFSLARLHARAATHTMGILYPQHCIRFVVKKNNCKWLNAVHDHQRVDSHAEFLSPKSIFIFFGLRCRVV